ncbi:nucleotide sugar dehydrogenase [Gammaproteobacteria bacterium]|nr:nucleotide sugar dehydrogenase [Gammaproteobacteria bacterium]MDC3312957.1 nucleotide sugar dehydrogenase [Gammaproteobacteria bacterium]
MEELNINKIAIIGLGYVGLPLAVEFGKSTFTIGYDINNQRIDELKSFEDKTLEVSKEELSLANRLEFTSDVNDLKDCNIFIITVPTPIDDVNRPDLNFIINASKTVAKVMSPGSIVIYESTVYPGCTEEICVPVLENISNLKFNKDFYCGYSPERINPGDKINTLTKITKITSGSTPEISQIVDDLYSEIIEAGTFKASSIKVAEAAKVIENTQRDLNIALINELSVIFQRIGIDTIDVLEAAGSKWNFLPFRPGLVGGHCIGVDPYYLTHKSEEVGYHPQVILAGRKINDSMASYVGHNFIRLMLRNDIEITKATIGIMGITFKENCPDIRNSKIIDLINELKSWNVNIVISDPWASKKEVKEKLGIELTTINEHNKVDSLIVAVGHKEYRSIKPSQLREYCNNDKPILADVKALYDRQDLIDAGFTFFRL